MWPMKILCPIPVQKQPHLYFRVISLAGLDYVSHEDIVPYTSTETATPIHHELFDKFLMPSPENCKFTTLYHIKRHVCECYVL